MFHLPTESEYGSSLASMKEKWSAPFFDYYNTNINPDIHGMYDGLLNLMGFTTPLVVSPITNQNPSIL